MLKVSKYKIIHLALLITMLKVSKYKFLHFAMFVIAVSRFVDIVVPFDLDKKSNISALYSCSKLLKQVSLSNFVIYP